MTTEELTELYKKIPPASTEQYKVRFAYEQGQKDANKKAKDLIRNIIRVTWKEGWSYSLDWKVKAEKFLEEVEND